MARNISNYFEGKKNRQFNRLPVFLCFAFAVPCRARPGRTMPLLGAAVRCLCFALPSIAVPLPCFAGPRLCCAKPGIAPPLLRAAGLSLCSARRGSAFATLLPPMRRTLFQSCATDQDPSFCHSPGIALSACQGLEQAFLSPVQTMFPLA